MAAIEIKTKDGSCTSYVYRPTGNGPWPAVLVYMDGRGIRPSMLEVGERLAANGYFVLLPDLYYRAGPLEQRDPQTMRPLAKATISNIMSDTQQFLDYIAAQPDVKQGKIGTTGYCMSGSMSITAAGTYPDRIAATASYHGGNLATDAPDSPHRIAPKIKSRVYVAGAIQDPGFTDDAKATLEAALTDAKVDHKIETYPAKHGWVFRDHEAYNAACSERHWTTLLELFGSKLPR